MAKGFLRSNTTVRIVSVIIAIALWFFIIITQDPKRNGRIDQIPIQYSITNQQLTQKGLVVINELPKNVSVSVYGARSIVTGIKGQFSANLDFSGINDAGYYNVPILITTPPGTVLNSKHPEYVEVYLDRYVTAEKPVNVNIVGEIGSGLSINKYLGTPEKLKVTAPSLIMEQILYLLASVDMTGVKTNISALYPALPYDKYNAIISSNYITYKENANNSQVIINVDLLKEKEVPINLALTKPLATEFTVKSEINPKTIKIVGPVNIIDNIIEVTTHAVSVNEKTAIETDLALTIPQDVSISGGASPVVRVKISVERN